MTDRIDLAAQKAGISRSEWIARAVTEQLAMEEGDQQAAREVTIPILVHQHEIQVREVRIAELRERISWTEGVFSTVSRQNEILVAKFPELPPPKEVGEKRGILAWLWGA